MLRLMEARHVTRHFPPHAPYLASQHNNRHQQQQRQTLKSNTVIVVTGGYKEETPLRVSIYPIIYTYAFPFFIFFLFIYILSFT